MTEGRITPLLADLVRGATFADAAALHRVPVEIVTRAASELVRRGLRQAPTQPATQAPG